MLREGATKWEGNMYNEKEMAHNHLLGAYIALDGTACSVPHANPLRIIGNRASRALCTES